MQKQLVFVSFWFSLGCGSDKAAVSGQLDPGPAVAGSEAPPAPQVPSATASLPAPAAAPTATAAAAPAPASQPAAMSGAAAPAPTYQPLMTGDWALQPGEESTRTCFKKTLSEDTFVSKIRPISPPGTHHSLLSMGDDPAADCTESIAQGLVYAAAAGTDGLQLPDGVAIKLPAGHTLKLGLHVFNATDTMLTGTSGIEIVTLRADEVKHESQAVLTGPAPFVLAPRQTQKLKSTCTLTGQQTVYAVFPHMHEYGRHLTTSVVAGGMPKTLHDAAFEFAEQRQYPLEPLVLNANDTITTECTFENNTDAWVEFGESTTTEMCVSVLFAYPPVSTGLCLGLPE